MQHRSGQTRQFTGFIQTQQRQQASIFHFTRIGAVHARHVAPDGDAGNPRQGANLGGGIVGTVTPQQHGFTRIVTADKTGHHQAFTRMLRHQLL